jgi:hypothetical protein
LNFRCRRASLEAHALQGGIVAAEKVQKLKESLKEAGYDQKAILAPSEMDRALEALETESRALDTPAEELRYIEGLLDLPMGYIEYFRVVPAPGYEKCRCGRVPSALDIVHHAYAQQIHARELLRDTLIGLRNIFELSDRGRVAGCYACGRPIVMAAYYKVGYGYA